MVLTMEELDIELEALQHTFDADSLDIARANDFVITARLQPRTGWGADDHAAQFVLCSVRLTLSPASYPETLPDISLLDVRGLGDARQHSLLSLLHQEAEQLRGMMMLGHVLESATCWLTENNAPEGDCAFCLNPMANDNQGADTSALTRLPCYHAFHTACYCRWWAWQQSDCAAREQDLVQHTGARAAATIMSDMMPPREQAPHHHLYSSSCPVCRAPSPLSQLPHLLPRLEQALEQAQADTGAGASQANGHGDGLANDVKAGVVSGVLTGQGVDVKRVQTLQQRHQRTWQRQLAAGGIISAPASYLLPAQGTATASMDNAVGEGLGVPGGSAGIATQGASAGSGAVDASTAGECNRMPATGVVHTTQGRRSASGAVVDDAAWSQLRISDDRQGGCKGRQAERGGHRRGGRAPGGVGSGTEGRERGQRRPGVSEGVVQTDRSHGLAGHGRAGGAVGQKRVPNAMGSAGPLTDTFELQS